MAEKMYSLGEETEQIEFKKSAGEIKEGEMTRSVHDGIRFEVANPRSNVSLTPIEETVVVVIGDMNKSRQKFSGGNNQPF